jgi:spore germination cell wall hydrolase CwlJ-like protein
LARAINASAAMTLGVWSPDGGGKLAASALALLTVLSMAASTQIPRHNLDDQNARRLAQTRAERGQPLNIALIEPASVAIAPQTYQQLTPQQAAVANAAVAFSSLPNPAAAAFKFNAAAPEDRARAIGCLTMAVYYEAASESDEGEAAVAQVVLNRLRHPLFPKTVCGVVFQGSTLPTGCQFTFTCDGSLARRPSPAGWKRAQDIATRALDGYVMKAVGEATHYHTMWVVPYWQPTLTKLTQIGAHIFYRWSGEAGRPASFGGLYAGQEAAPPPIEGIDNGAAVLTLASAAPTAADALKADEARAALVASQAADAAATAAAAAPPVETKPVAPAPPPPPKKPSYFGAPRTASNGAAHLPW